MKKQAPRLQQQHSVPVHFKSPFGKQSVKVKPSTMQPQPAVTPPTTEKHGTTPPTSDNRTCPSSPPYSSEPGSGVWLTDSASHLLPPEIEKLAVELFTIGRNATNAFYYDPPVCSWTQLSESARIGWRTIAVYIIRIAVPR